MTGNVMKFTGLGFAMLLIAACSAPEKRSLWQNPDIPVAEWGIDRAACARYARREVTRLVGANLEPTRTDNLGGGTGSYNQQMTQYRAQRVEADAYAECMTLKGYRKGVASPAS